MLFKFGVKFDSARAPIWYALGVIDKTSRLLCNQPAVVTSLVDGEHKEGSLHPLGHAADIRTHHLSGDEKDLLFKSLSVELKPTGFDVIFKDRGQPNEHLHCEYVPQHGERLFRWTE